MTQRPVREDRDEIMRLILKLHGRRASGASVLEAAAQRAVSPPRLASPMRSTGAAAPTDPFVVDLLQRLDVRLERIETLLTQRTSSATSSSRSASAGSADALFGGIIKEAVLPDMLQLVTSNQMSGTFVISDDNTSHSLFFRDGDLFHAEGAGIRGEQSVFAAMALENGRYEFTETEDLPSETTVTSNTQLLILEALRQIDESRAG